MTETKLIFYTEGPDGEKIIQYITTMKDPPIHRRSDTMRDLYEKVKDTVSQNTKSENRKGFGN